MKTVDEIKLFLKSVKTRVPNKNNEDEVLNSLKEIKKECVRQNAEEGAKELWCLESTLKIQENYIDAFSKMKGGSFYEGWRLLEQCEITLGFLEPHFAMYFPEYTLDFIKEKVSKFQSLFPYDLFMSPEILIHEKKCSICDQKVSIRNGCGHEKGEIYGGEMCVREVDRCEFLGTALVKNPVQKYSVIFLSDPKTGKSEDHYNYDLVKYLIEKLNSPFDDWDMIWTKKLHPHSKFTHMGRDDKCPCGSDKEYKRCCLVKDGVLMKHCIFKIS